ncbi:MAG: hypothetical protein JOZ60_09275 [Verrucomicrobia bacterium]|nr:hypothetical protein [Verrucomicrobiota bacterium]
MSILTEARASSCGRVLALVLSLLLGACADTETATKDHPTFFGNAGASIDGGGATGGMSLKW